MRLSQINAFGPFFLTFALICITLVTLAGCGLTESTNSSPTLLPLLDATPTVAVSYVGTKVEVTVSSPNSIYNTCMYVHVRPTGQRPVSRLLSGFHMEVIQED